MTFSFDLVVENLWFSPDGSSRGAEPGADADWLIRNAGWVLVQCTPGRIAVTLDIRCAGSTAVAAALDALRARGLPSSRRAAPRFDVRIHDGGEVERAGFDDPLKACHHLLRCIERADEIEACRFLLHRQRIDRVTTEELPLTRVRENPRMAAFLSLWGRGTAPSFPAAVPSLAKDISMFRIEDGEPRLVSLGGALLFGARDARGARLDDILPRAQAEQSRLRILAATGSGLPVLRRHRSPTYEVELLTVPVQRAGETLAVSITERRDLPITASAGAPEVAAPEAAQLAPARRKQRQGTVARMRAIR